MATSASKTNTTAPRKKAATKKATAKSRPSRKTGTSSIAKSAAGKKKADRKPGGKAPGNARNVFLAGLGAYGKAFDEAQAQLEESREKANGIFDELVKRGEKVENKARKTLKNLDLPGELKVPELKLADHDEIRDELRSRLDKARASFNTLRDAVSLKSGER